MIDLENKLLEVIDGKGFILSKRVKRFIAMYFPNSIVRKKFWLETNVLLGEGTYLNLNISVVDNYQENEVLLEIGNHCSIAPGVVFAPYSSHNNSILLRDLGLLKKYEKKGKIIVGDDVWIGANCTFLPGVKIGNCSIIGANSLVNKDIPDFSLAYGNPVQIIKDLRK
jgi:acetyltransferase-like isoleucine patch superfamily enzyme